MAPVGRGSINYCCLHTSLHTVQCVQPYLDTLYHPYLVLLDTTGRYYTVFLYSTNQHHSMLQIICKPSIQYTITHSLNCFTVPDPNGVSAGQRWLVQGNSSAETMPIISFYTVVALGTLLHYLQCGTEEREYKGQENWPAG